MLVNFLGVLPILTPPCVLFLLLCQFHNFKYQKKNVTSRLHFQKKKKKNPLEYV
jgi:hypothetical protein